jgi:hypothetical protein
MTVLSFLRELYSLDTLDTRFTHSSTPPKPVNEHAPKQGARDGKTQTQPTDASPPRWRTPEFYVYLVVFLVCVPQMYWAVVSVSQRRFEQTRRGTLDLTKCETQRTRPTTRNMNICFLRGCLVGKWYVERDLGDFVATLMEVSGQF